MVARFSRWKVAHPAAATGREEGGTGRLCERKKNPEQRNFDMDRAGVLDGSEHLFARGPIFFFFFTEVYVNKNANGTKKGRNH